MKFALSITNFGDYFHPRRLADLAYDAEKSGWDGFFLLDHMIFERSGNLEIVFLKKSC